MKQPIFDADRHVIEPIELWRTYLDPEWRERAPYEEVIATPELLRESLRLYGKDAPVIFPPTTMLEGKPVYRRITDRATIEMARVAEGRARVLATGTDAEAQLRWMDETGVPAAAMFPTFGLAMMALDDVAPDHAAALARAYNRWLADFCSVAPDRLIPVGLVSAHDPERMLAAVEAIAARGWRSLALRPEAMGGRHLGRAEYAPVWAACAHHGLTLALHGGAHMGTRAPSVDRFETHFAQMVSSHPIEQQLALLGLMEGGVLARHPGLKVVLLESGCGWLPYWLWRMDHYFHDMPAELAGRLDAPPSEVFARQCWIGIEPDEADAAALVGRIGADRLVVGTDFPHLDASLEVTADARRLAAGLEPAQADLLLWENAATLYRG